MIIRANYVNITPVRKRDNFGFDTDDMDVEIGGYDEDSVFECIQRQVCITKLIDAIYKRKDEIGVNDMDTLELCLSSEKIRGIILSV